MEDVLGYAAAIGIGFIMGLVGGGGSILTLPVLTYMLGLEVILSTSYSLFIVGSTAVAGSIQYMRKGQLDYRTAIVFAVPALAAVYFTRMFLIPAIPDQLFYVGDFRLTRHIAIMLLFAALMIFAAVSMIRSAPVKTSASAGGTRFKFGVITVEGIVVGVLTGIVGAGGGFLIIPALVLLGRLPMKTAVGTSLLIVAAKSLIGFLGDVNAGQPIDWPFLLSFTGLAVGGIYLGSFASTFISGKRLQKGFGWFILFMSIFIFAKEFFWH